MPRPAPTDSAPFYHKYIERVPESEPLDAFQAQAAWLTDWLNSFQEEQGEYAYAPGKWTIKQVFQHLIDTERIFAHRALWFARCSPEPQPGFDENAYAQNAGVTHRSLTSLKEELLAVRRSTFCLLESFTEMEFTRSGTASGNYVTVNALAFMMLGHVLHHKQVLEERYINPSTH
jgi:uncharacterized damage-inducible protein DinB